jgi:hypothetical protein
MDKSLCLPLAASTSSSPRGCGIAEIARAEILARREPTAWMPRDLLTETLGNPKNTSG